MKKIIITVLLLLILFCASPSVNAWIPPAGCDADSWILIHNLNFNYVGVEFFKGNTMVCEILLKNADNSTILWGTQGFEFDASGEVDQSPSFMGNMKTADYAFLVGVLGLICGLVFVFGLKQ